MCPSTYLLEETEVQRGYIYDEVTQLLNGSCAVQRSGSRLALASAVGTVHMMVRFFDLGFPEPGGAGPGGCWG